MEIHIGQMSSIEIESAVFKWWLEADKFRVGSFKDAEDKVKKAWIEYFCTYMIGPLNEKVKKNIYDLSKKKLSKLISSCDEAFVMYLLKRNGGNWYTYCNEDMEYSYKNTKSPKKRKNYKVNVEELTDLTNEIYLKRQKNETGQDWDEAFRMFRKEMSDKEKLEKQSQDSVSLYTQASIDDTGIIRRWQHQYAYLDKKETYNMDSDGTEN